MYNALPSLPVAIMHVIRPYFVAVDVPELLPMHFSLTISQFMLVVMVAGGIKTKEHTFKLLCSWPVVGTHNRRKHWSDQVVLFVTTIKELSIT